MAVDVKTDTDRFEAGTPKPVFEAPVAGVLRNMYVASPDGQRFLINTRIESTSALPVTVVLNWLAGVKR